MTWTILLTCTIFNSNQCIATHNIDAAYSDPQECWSNASRLLSNTMFATCIPPEDYNLTIFKNCEMYQEDWCKAKGLME